MGTLRRFDDDTTSMRLHTDFLSTLKRFCLSKRMQLYKTINSVKSIFPGFWAMVQSSYYVKKVLAYTYFVFCILYITLFKECFSLIPIKKILKVPDSSSEIFLVIKTIGLIWDTFLSLCVWGTSLKILLKIINANLALTI